VLTNKFIAGITELTGFFSCLLVTIDFWHYINILYVCMYICHPFCHCCMWTSLTLFWCLLDWLVQELYHQNILQMSVESEDRVWTVCLLCNVPSMSVVLSYAF